MAFLRRAGLIGRRYPLPILAAAGLAGGLAARMFAASGAPSQSVFLATLVIAGAPVVIRTAIGLVHGRFAADLVASLAIIGAAVTGEYLAGCVIVLMQTGGEALEDYGVRRASASLEALLARAPRRARIRRGDRDEEVAIEVVSPGDVIVIHPGELVPVDCLVIEGTSAVDESALTGEPIPITAGPGRELMSGSVCLDGALEARAVRRSAESQYEQIVRLVRNAQNEKAPIGRLADRYAVYFTPLTLAMCAVAYAITRRPEAVVAVLVVATPCPLILATPIAVMSGINRAARRGIITKSGAAIERVGRIKAVVFDKTGTLTVGVPAVERIVPVNGLRPEELARLAAGVEQRSNHPMARALVAAAPAPLPRPSGITETAGQGVSGQVDGHRVDVGSAAFAHERALADLAVIEQARADAGGDGATSFVGVDGRLAGVILFADQVRPETKPLLARLPGLGVRATSMLTGDDTITARDIAQRVGIDTVQAELLPGQKVEAVREMLREFGDVAMVGDGINDAPALATATVGIALGAHGAAVSAEAADVVITTDDVSRVADAIEIGQNTLRVALQSIYIGLGLSGAMMVVAALGYIPPTIGALLQEVLDVAVILNALRAR